MLIIISFFRMVLFINVYNNNNNLLLYCCGLSYSSVPLSTFLVDCQYNGHDKNV